MKKIINLVRKQKKIFNYLNYRTPIFHKLSDITFIKMSYKMHFGKNFNIDNPQTFNEKLQWLKLYDRNEIYSIMVDKYEVKKYISDIIGEEYIIPTIGVYNKFDEIDFSKLPNQYVIKCTHDSGGLVIVKDKSKLNIKDTKKKINQSLKRNFYYVSREWPYKNVKPRIIIEKYMEDYKTKELRDYKFFCFNGKVHFFKIDFNRATKHQANYYDINGNILKFGEEMCPPDFNKKLEMPSNLNKMIEFAEKLSRNMCFIRVDFYEMNDRIYFGELTFFPSGGFGVLNPSNIDLKLGNLIDISEVKK